MGGQLRRGALPRPDALLSGCATGDDGPPVRTANAASAEGGVCLVQLGDVPALQLSGRAAGLTLGPGSRAPAPPPGREVLQHSGASPIQREVRSAVEDSLPTSH